MLFSDLLINFLDPIDILTEYSRMKHHKKFNEAILTWKIWLVNEPQEFRGEVEEHLVKEIELQASELKDSSFRSLLIKESNKIIMPVFSSQHIASLYVKNLVRERNEIYSVGMMAVSGDFLLGIDLDRIEIIMNYKTDKVTGLNRMIKNIKENKV